MIRVLALVADDEVIDKDGGPLRRFPIEKLIEKIGRLQVVVQGVTAEEIGNRGASEFGNVLGQTVLHPEIDSAISLRKTVDVDIAQDRRQVGPIGRVAVQERQLGRRVATSGKQVRCVRADGPAATMPDQMHQRAIIG